MIIGTITRTGKPVRLEVVQQVLICGGGSPGFMVVETSTDLLILVNNPDLKRQALNFAHQNYTFETPMYLNEWVEEKNA